jgi:ABC-type uncharacterized transport system ATPase subunit
MKKVLLTAAIVVALGGLVYYFTRPTCEELDPQVKEQILENIGMVHFQYLMSVDQAAVKRDICKKNHDTEDCELTTTDVEEGIKVIQKQINEMIEADLEAQNICVDERFLIPIE